VRNQVELDEVLDAGDYALKASIYKIMPGVVVAYHAGVAGKSQPSVDVQPGVSDVRIDTETGALVFEPWPIIPSVPLAMLKGGGGGIAFALAKNDCVTLISWDLDPSKFRGTGAAADPIDTHRHGGGHWQALPFDITDQGAAADPGGDMVITPPKGGSVVVGPGATDFVALASLVKTALEDLAAWVKTGKQAFAPSGAPAPLTFATPYSADSVASTVLKSK
jgi:hypothetical protein